MQPANCSGYSHAHNFAVFGAPVHSSGCDTKMAPEGNSKPRSCPEPGRMYLGFERKSSQPAPQPVSPHSPGNNTPRPKSLLSLQLACKVQDDMLADDDSDFDDDESNSGFDSLDPSQCASLSSSEIARELLSNSQDSSSVATRTSESQTVEDEYSFLAPPASSFLPKNLTTSSEIDIPTSASMMAQQRSILRQVIYQQQVSQMLAACTEYQKTMALKDDLHRPHCGSA